jgi:hypothetical protein
VIDALNLGVSVVIVAAKFQEKKLSEKESWLSVNPGFQRSGAGCKHRTLKFGSGDWRR